MKSCDRGLENAVAYKWACLRKLNWLTCRLQTIVKKSNERTSELRHYTKSRFISKYFMLVACSSPVKFSNDQR